MSPAADTLSQTFAALSDPTRRAMLSRLLQSEATVNELAAPFKMSLPAVSKHIKVLEKAGLLIKTRQAQQRPCKINGEQLRQAVDWIEQYRLLWEGEIASHPDASKPVESPVKVKTRAHKPARSTSAPDQSKRAQRPARDTLPAKEKADENALQQQTGFDF